MAAGTDTLSMITADLATPDVPVATETPEPAISAETTAEIDGIPGDEEAIAAPEVPAEPEAEAAPETAPSEDEKPQIENLTESRWKTVHAGYKYVRELGKALGVVGEDGRVDVSLFPPIDQIQGMEQAYSDRMAMEHDFSSATPENAAQFIENWNGFSPEGMQTVAAQLPDFLAAKNPQAYMAVAQPVMKRALDYMYQRGAQMDDEGVRKYVVDAARAMEWWLAGGPDARPGSYRSDEQIQQLLNQRQPSAPNQTEQELAQARRQLQEINQRTSESKWNGLYESVKAEVGRQFSTDVDKVLAPLKAHYPNDLTFGAVKQSFVSQVQTAMGKDAAGRRQYELAVERARRTQTPGDKEAVQSAWLNMTRRAIHTTRGAFVTEASKGIKQANDARHTALAKGAAKVGPASGGAPRAQSIVAKIERLPGESMSEWNYRKTVHDMSQ